MGVQARKTPKQVSLLAWLRHQSFAGKSDKRPGSINQKDVSSVIMTFQEMQRLIFSHYPIKYFKKEAFEV